MTPPPPPISELPSLSRSALLSALGGVYEKSPWVAELFADALASGAVAPPDVDTARKLAQTLASIVDDSSRERKTELLRSHPDLCHKVEKMGELTEESREEQGRAGLQSLTPEERKSFLDLNSRYRTKFGFPFILAVRNATKYTVLSALKGRIDNSVDVEFVGALGQVHKIAWMRILGAVRIDEPKGFLTCHVLDTAHGCPAAGMRVRLIRLSPPEYAGPVGEFITNSDGRLPSGPALKGSDFIVGVYEWTFYAGDYFAQKGAKTAGQPFLDEVPIRFGMDDPDEHYHVPLLVSPWSFSTYRGS